MFYGVLSGSAPFANVPCMRPIAWIYHFRSRSCSNITTTFILRLMFFIWVTCIRPVTIISLIWSRVIRKVGRIREIPEKNRWPHANRTEFASHVIRIGSNDEEWFRPLKIGVLPHSTMGTAILRWMKVVGSDVWFGSKTRHLILLRNASGTDT